MAAPKGNKFAKGNKGGNPGYGQMDFIKNNVNKYSELWWKEWEQMMKGNMFAELEERIKQWAKEGKDKNGKIWLKDIVEKALMNTFDEKKFAMAEYNKLQVKLIPTQLTGEDGGDIKMTIKWQNNTLKSPIARDNGRTTSTKQPSAG